MIKSDQTYVFFTDLVFEAFTFELTSGCCYKRYTIIYLYMWNSDFGIP